MRIIQGKKGRDKYYYYYDEENLTVSDKDGNVIKLHESIDGVAESNVSWYLDMLFHQLYIGINETNCVLRNDKVSKVVWRDW